MRWFRVNEHGFDYGYLLSERGETDRAIVAAVAACTLPQTLPTEVPAGHTKPNENQLGGPSLHEQNRRGTA